MIRKLTVFLFPITFLFFIKPAFAIDNLSAICHGGTYDYCSEAPKCGEYADKSYDWFVTNVSPNPPFVMEIFQTCNEADYNYLCQGYVPLCCYELARTHDKDMCAGMDTNYCMPVQCAQAPNSVSTKSCSVSSKHWCEAKKGIDITNVAPIPLSQRFPNDVLFYIIDNYPAAKARTQAAYPNLWNLYQQWKASGGGNPPPVQPTAQPTTPPGQPTTAIPTATPYIPYQPPIGYPTNPPGTYISPPGYNPPNNPPYNPPYNPPVFPSSVPSNIFGTPSHAKPTTFVPLPYIFSITAPIENIKVVKNRIVNGVTTVSKGLYERFIYFIENYLP